MGKKPTPRLTHCALFVHDIEEMQGFYTRVMGLTVTDRGRARTAPIEMVFMSNDPAEHHQFVIVSGRPAKVEFHLNQQMSFYVDSLDELRVIDARVRAEGAADRRAACHGNAWSVYFNDPEGNNIEVYTHSPWYVPQPNWTSLDLSKPNEQIFMETEKYCRSTPGFMTRAERESKLARAMGRSQ